MTPATVSPSCHLPPFVKVAHDRLSHNNIQTHKHKTCTNIQRAHTHKQRERERERSLIILNRVWSHFFFWILRSIKGMLCMHRSGRGWRRRFGSPIDICGSGCWFNILQKKVSGKRGNCITANILNSSKISSVSFPLRYFSLFKWKNQIGFSPCDFKFITRRTWRLCIMKSGCGRGESYYSWKPFLKCDLNK